MNKIILMGRLTKDPEISQGDNLLIARYSLAVDRPVADKDGTKADFFNCSCFGKTAEFVQKYLAKGMKMLIEGRVQNGSYIDRNGVKRYTTTVIVERHEFAESKKAQAENSGALASGGNSVDTPVNNSVLPEFMNIPEGFDEGLPF